MRRWLRWTFYCLRGRRCANLVVGDFESDAPPGSILRIGYECVGCRTVYEAVYLIGEDNATLDRMLEQRRSGFLIAKGESATVHFDPEEDEAP